MEPAGELLFAYDVRYEAASDQGGSGKLLEVERPTLFETPFASGQPRLWPRGDPRRRRLPDQFSRFLEVLTERHEVARNRERVLSGERWTPLEPTLPRRIAERMMKRVMSVLRDARHGGTVIFVPTENAKEPSREDPYIALIYSSSPKIPSSDSPAQLRR